MKRRKPSRRHLSPLAEAVHHFMTILNGPARLVSIFAHWGLDRFGIKFTFHPRLFSFAIGVLILMATVMLSCPSWMHQHVWSGLMETGRAVGACPVAEAMCGLFVSVGRKV